jgi:hypothetical protein
MFTKLQRLQDDSDKTEKMKHKKHVPQSNTSVSSSLNTVVKGGGSGGWSSGFLQQKTTTAGSRTSVVTRSSTNVAEKYDPNANIHHATEQQRVSGNSISNSHVGESSIAVPRETVGTSCKNESPSLVSNSSQENSSAIQNKFPQAFTGTVLERNTGIVRGSVKPMPFPGSARKTAAKQSTQPTK